MNFDEEFARFEVIKKDTRNSTDKVFNSAVKLLVIALLSIVVLLLSVYTYRFLVKDDVTNPLVKKLVIAKQPPKQKKLSQAEIAIIVQTVIAQMQKSNNQSHQNITKKSEDSELLQSLQSVNVEKEQQKVQEKEKPKNIVAKKVQKKKEPEYIKKQVVYNAVVIGNKEIKNTSDLARLYASINKISRSKKRKILKNAYTKKIRKEIIIRKNAMRTITVREGDTLGSIARRAYGKASLFTKIYEANPDLLSNPHNLRVGMKLRVPK